MAILALYLLSNLIMIQLQLCSSSVKLQYLQKEVSSPEDPLPNQLNELASNEVINNSNYIKLLADTTGRKSAQLTEKKSYNHPTRVKGSVEWKKVYGNVDQGPSEAVSAYSSTENEINSREIENQLTMLKKDKKNEMPKNIQKTFKSPQIKSSREFNKYPEYERGESNVRYNDDEPYLLYLQRKLPSTINKEQKSHEFHQLFKPRLNYHLQYVTTQRPTLKNQQYITSMDSIQYVTTQQPIPNNNMHYLNSQAPNHDLHSLTTQQSISNLDGHYLTTQESLSMHNLQYLTTQISTQYTAASQDVVGSPKSNNDSSNIEGITTDKSTYNDSSTELGKHQFGNDVAIEKNSSINADSVTKSDINGGNSSLSDSLVNKGPSILLRHQPNITKLVNEKAPPNSKPKPNNSGLGLSSSIKKLLNHDRYRTHYENNNNYEHFYNRNIEILTNNTNIIFNSDIIHPHQHHLQLQHERKQLLKQQKETETNNKEQDKGYHKHNHHHHALLPPSMQLPILNNAAEEGPRSPVRPSPTANPNFAPPVHFLNNVPSFIDFGNTDDYFSKPVWEHWVFWVLTITSVIIAVSGVCNYFRKKKVYESSSSQTIGSSPGSQSVAPPPCNGVNNTSASASVPLFPGIPFLNHRINGNHNPMPLGFSYFPPAESPSMDSISPMYGPPLEFLPPTVYTPLAPPPYSEATSDSYDRITSDHLANIAENPNQYRSIYDYYDRRHPNAYYDRYFPPSNSAADDTSSSDTTSLLSYRLHRSFSVHLPTRGIQSKKINDLPPPPPYCEVTAKPELYPVVVMDESDYLHRRTQSTAGICTHSAKTSDKNSNCDVNTHKGPNKAAQSSIGHMHGGAINGFGGCHRRRRSLGGFLPTVMRSGRGDSNPMQQHWLPPCQRHHSGLSSSSTEQDRSERNIGAIQCQGDQNWSNGKSRVSTILSSQIVSPTSSPLPSDMSSPPPTSPPSPPAPTSPSGSSPIHFLRKKEISRHGSVKSSKGSELKELLHKINQLPGVPTPPISPPVSKNNLTEPYQHYTPSTPRDTPSPSTTASTPSLEIGSTAKKFAKLASKGLQIDVCRTHSLMHKAKYNSQKSYFQSLHFPRSRRKSLGFLRSPQSSSGSSTPQLSAQSFKNIIMQSPQTVLQSPRSSNSSSHNIQALMEPSKSYIPYIDRRPQKNFSESPQTVLQSPPTPQSPPHSSVLPWSLSTPNLAGLMHQLPIFTQNQQCQPPHSYRHHKPFSHMTEEPPLEIDEEMDSDDKQDESDQSSYRCNLPSHQNYRDNHHRTKSPHSSSGGHFQNHYPQRYLPNNEQVENESGLGTLRELATANLLDNELIHDGNDEDEHVYSNIDLPMVKPENGRDNRH